MRFLFFGGRDAGRGRSGRMQGHYCDLIEVRTD